MATNIEMVHVPERDTPAAQSALLAGYVVFDAVSSSMPRISDRAHCVRLE